MSRFPTLDALKTLADRLDVTVEVEEASPEHAAMNVRVLQLRHASGAWRVPCFDEYGDAEIESRVVRLHLLVDACECLEQAPDFDTWRRDIGLPDDSPTREMHAQLVEVVPAVRALVGPEAAAISAHAIEFGLDLARALRDCRD